MAYLIPADFATVQEARDFLNRYPFLIHQLRYQVGRYRDDADEAFSHILHLQKTLKQNNIPCAYRRQLKDELDTWHEKNDTAVKYLQNLPTEAELDQKRMEARQYLLDHMY